MILKEYEIEGLLNKNNLTACMLIFGPNEGLIRENILNISNKFKINDDADEISINGKNLDDNPEFLLDEVNTFSMFNKKKVIHIENIKDKHLNFIETLNLKDLKNILIIIKSENLKKNSKLMKLDSLRVSVYGVDEKSYEFITTLKKSYKTVKKNCINFLIRRNEENPKLKFGLNYIILKENYHNLPKLIDFIAEIIGRQLMGFIDDDKVPFGIFEFLLEIFISRELI